MKNLIVFTLLLSFLLTAILESRELDSPSLLSFCQETIIKNSVCTRKNDEESIFDNYSSSTFRDWENLLTMVHSGYQKIFKR